MTIAPAMAALQSVSTGVSPEPIVTGALVAGGGVVLLWFAQKVLWLVKTMQSVMIALYGDENQEPPNGIMRKLGTLAKTLETQTRRLDAHCTAEDQWKADAVRLATARSTETMLMLKGIESRLDRRGARRTPPKGTSP